MAAVPKTPFWMRMGNMLATTLVRLGIRMGPIYLLTVRGRKSGQPRTTPIAVVEHEGKRYLIGLYGPVNWVRNLRAAGEGILQYGRKSWRVRASELAPKEGAPVLRTALRMSGGPEFVRERFSVTKDSPLEEFEREVPTHPIFLLENMA